MQKELKIHQKIQFDQGKALEKISNETDQPGKLRHLQEELRIGKERIKELEEKCRKEEKSSMQIHEYMIKLEENCRELKAKLNQKNPAPQNSEQSVIEEIN